MKTLKHLFSKLRVPRPSRSASGQPVLVRLSACLFAICLLVPAAVRAATAPPATLMYTASGPVHGGVATIGTSGVTYLTVLSANGNPAKVIALNANSTEKWPPFTPGADMYAIPALDAAGAKLYIGSDAGKFYCRNTSDGSTPAGWTDFTVTTGTDKRIRSGAALDPNNPLGSTVYFQCNDGYLYALNADTGAQRWRAHTGNEGGPPVEPSFVPNPVSSSPVVDSSGVVYVGSADGSSIRSILPPARRTGVCLWASPLKRLWPSDRTDGYMWRRAQLKTYRIRASSLRSTP